MMQELLTLSPAYNFLGKNPKVHGVANPKQRHYIVYKLFNNFTFFLQN